MLGYLTLPRQSAERTFRIREFVAAARTLYRREQRRVREEIARVPGLFALLMKPRNGASWTRKEKNELRARLRGIGRLGLYLIVIAAPGTEITLPLLAWWLDRRQTRRDRFSTALKLPA